ncbi:MAG: hypothetical protein ACLQVJ_29580 [Syntrophobacteraceae bacterium]
MKEQKVMSGCFYLFTLVSIVSALLLPALAGAQDYPIMDRVADKVIQKYQTSSCQELAMQKGHRPTGKKAAMEARAIEILRGDPQMRAEFINRVAPPIANKLFECGMIP